jgi:hypothetical protein
MGTAAWAFKQFSSGLPSDALFWSRPRAKKFGALLTRRSVKHKARLCGPWFVSGV